MQRLFVVRVQAGLPDYWLPVNARRKITGFIVTAVAVTAVDAQPSPRHIADLGRAGYLAMPTGEPPEMMSVAGARYLELVPDSRQEVCYRMLLHHAGSVKGLYRLRVVDASGKEIWKCSL
jgi:hypothetical protein